MMKNGLIALRPLGVRADGLVRLLGGAAQFSVRGVSCAKGALALENGRVLIAPLSPTAGGCRGALAVEGSVVGAGVFRAGEVLLAGSARGNSLDAVVARIRQAAACDAAKQSAPCKKEAAAPGQNGREAEEPGETISLKKTEKEKAEKVSKAAESPLPDPEICAQSEAANQPSGEMQPPVSGALADVIGQRPEAEDLLRGMPHPAPPAQTPQEPAQQALRTLAERMAEQNRKDAAEAEPASLQNSGEDAAPVRLWEGLPREEAQADDGAETRIYIARKAPDVQALRQETAQESAAEESFAAENDVSPESADGEAALNALAAEPPEGSGAAEGMAEAFSAQKETNAAEGVRPLEEASAAQTGEAQDVSAAFLQKSAQPEAVVGRTESAGQGNRTEEDRTEAADSSQTDGTTDPAFSEPPEGWTQAVFSQIQSNEQTAAGPGWAAGEAFAETAAPPGESVRQDEERTGAASAFPAEAFEKSPELEQRVLSQNQVELSNRRETVFEQEAAAQPPEPAREEPRQTEASCLPRQTEETAAGRAFSSEASGKEEAAQPVFQSEPAPTGQARGEQSPEEARCPCAWEQGERAAALAALFAPANGETAPDFSPEERCVLPSNRWEAACMEGVLQQQPAWKPGRGRLMGVFVNAFPREYPRQNWQIFSQAGSGHVLRCLCVGNGPVRYALPARDMCAPPPGLPAGSRLLNARNGRKYWVFSAKER